MVENVFRVFGRNRTKMRSRWHSQWFMIFLLGCALGSSSRESDGWHLGLCAENSSVVRIPMDVGRRECLSTSGRTDLDFPELHNLIQINRDIFSGAEPKSEAAFKQLADLGVKAIVSVDGARPRVDLAEKYGMRYVHIPIGYDGFDENAVSMFAKAADELVDTIYVHCHHGKHRGPAGAAAICVARGLFDGQQSLKILEQAGTSKEYSGLWRDVENFKRPPSDVELPSLVSVAVVDSLAVAMAKIDRATGNLKRIREAGWQTPKPRPDLSMAQEALLLSEAFHETIRQLQVSNAHDERLLIWMKESEQRVFELRESIAAGNIKEVETNFHRVQARCNDCHTAYRN